MTQSQPSRIQAEAAVALAEWKSFFAEQVASNAKELASASNSPGLITLEHYRQAAATAVQSLMAAVQETGPSDGGQQAA